MIGVIPARGGSQRLPGKNLFLLRGTPLIAYTIEMALKASSLKRVFVSTDNPDIAETAKIFNAEVVMRPQELATDESPIDDALRHVVEYLRAEQGFHTDIVVSMQANVPIRKDGEIDRLVQGLQATAWATAIATACKVSQRPEWAKLLISEGTMEIRSLMEAGTSYRTQDLPDLYFLDGSIIAVRAEVLQNTAGDRRVHAYLGDRVIIEVHDPMYALEIDELQDVRLAEFYLGH